EQAAGGAAVDSTPEGTRLMNYILQNERGCDAALRRLEIGRKPDRPGPKRAPKEPEAAPVAAEPEPEPPPQPPAPADVAATRPTIEATETERDDVPGLLTADTDADFSTLEAIADPTQSA